MLLLPCLALRVRRGAVQGGSPLCRCAGPAVGVVALPPNHTLIPSTSRDGLVAPFVARSHPPSDLNSYRAQMAIAPSSSSVSDHPINGHSIAALVILLVANLLVVHPLAIPLPLALSSFLRSAAYQLRITSSPTGGNATDGARLTGGSTRSSSSGVAGGGPTAGGQKPASRLRVRLGLVSAPLGGVLILLASKTIGGETVAKGIAGDPDGLKPYDISTFPSFPPSQSWMPSLETATLSLRQRSEGY